MDLLRVPHHRHRQTLVGAVLGDLEAPTVDEGHDHRERAAQRWPGVGGRVAEPDPAAAGEVHHQVERRNREIKEFPTALAAVKGEALERTHRRVERLEHGH